MTIVAFFGALIGVALAFLLGGRQAPGAARIFLFAVGGGLLGAILTYAVLVWLVSRHGV